ncbi:Translin-associated protein X [Merluccius polli]|uniref:Translin-associated protein X n=1 Tax=Merluccius polli TaxID=89951 RepID=A0AA47P0Z0_MERPO|nr:Translin-associated protein X [Merluccius polli]
MSKGDAQGCRKKSGGLQDRDMSGSLSSPVIAAFRGTLSHVMVISDTPVFNDTIQSVFQQELDTKHDKHERLVKISRDITIESKRTIFLLHRVTSVTDIESVLKESDVKLDSVRQKIAQIAEELRGEDLYQFHRAFTAGIQEYVEAVSFQHYIRHRTLISLEEINARLVFIKIETMDSKESTEDTPAMPVAPAVVEVAPALTFQVIPSDYLLGVADLTGELMRMCIGSVGNGDIDTPFQLSQFLRQVHDGFSYIGNTGPYEVSKKLHTLRQSLAKVEDACYALRVRGSEIPKHMLADVFASRDAMMDADEGVA